MVWMELGVLLAGGGGVGERTKDEGLRRCHAALLDDELAELEADAAVVCGLGDQSCRVSASVCECVCVGKCVCVGWACACSMGVCVLDGREGDLPWTAPTILPSLPWALLAALLTAPAALLAALPTELAAESAELLTLVRPSDALDCALDAASPAFSFAAPAASDVVEALRMPARRTASRDWRTSARDTAKDIVMVRRRGWAMERGVDGRLSLRLVMRGARAFFHNLALPMY